MPSIGILLVDLLSILPDEVECYIQAPSLENPIIQNMMVDELIRLDKMNKQLFIDAIMIDSTIAHFNKVEIRSNGKSLFIGYDGIGYGTLSNSIIIPEWFTQAYVSNGDCVISNEW
jgi:hypothetical protein